jgi:hypothetical protein
MFRVEHTGGMSLGIPIIRNDNITFAKFTLDKFSYTSQYYKLPSHEMTRVSVITSNLKRVRERSRPLRRHPGNVRYQRQKVTRISPHPGNYRPMLIGTDISIPAGGRKTPRKSSEYYYMDSKCERAHSSSYNTIIIVLL